MTWLLSIPVSTFSFQTTHRDEQCYTWNRIAIRDKAIVVKACYGPFGMLLKRQLNRIQTFLAELYNVAGSKTHHYSITISLSLIDGHTFCRTVGQSSSCRITFVALLRVSKSSSRKWNCLCLSIIPSFSELNIHIVTCLRNHIKDCSYVCEQRLESSNSDA